MTPKGQPRRGEEEHTVESEGPAATTGQLEKAITNAEDSTSDVHAQ